MKPPLAPRQFRQHLKDEIIDLLDYNRDRGTPNGLKMINALERALRLIGDMERRLKQYEE